jgi:hypothetical protein
MLDCTQFSLTFHISLQVLNEKYLSKIKIQIFVHIFLYMPA